MKNYLALIAACLLFVGHSTAQNGQIATIQQAVKSEIATCVTATNDLFTEGSVRIAPNPSNGQFQISAVLKERNADALLSLTVYSLDGKAVFEKKNREYRCKF